MPDPLKLREAFAAYWEEMQRCVDSKAYWALLHVTVCLPDICAALQVRDGRAKPFRYRAWCNAYLKDRKLTGVERYRMRCKLLHQGRSTTDGPGWRYVGFAFGQPSIVGVIDHRRKESGVLYLDSGELASEMRRGVEAWTAHLEASPTGPKARNVVKNLRKHVRVHVSATVKAPPARAEALAGKSSGPVPQEFGSIDTRNVTKSG